MHPDIYLIWLICHHLFIFSNKRGPDTAAPQIDPLGPYTPEVDAALHDAKEARNRSAMLRRQAQNIMNNVQNTQKDMHKSVNDGMTSKAAETADLKVDISQGC